MHKVRNVKDSYEQSASQDLERDGVFHAASMSMLRMRVNRTSSQLRTLLYIVEQIIISIIFFTAWSHCQLLTKNLLSIFPTTNLQLLPEVIKV